MKRTEQKEIINRLKSIQEKHASRPRPILLRYGDGHEEKTLEYAYPNGILNTRYIFMENYSEWLFYFKGETEYRSKELTEMVAAIVYLDSGETNDIKEQARNAVAHPLTEEELTEITQEIKREAQIARYNQQRKGQR